MKKVLLLLAAIALSLGLRAQQYVDLSELEGQSCTSIMVGKKATTDGSVITSHTCDGRYRTWMHIEPAANYKEGATVPVFRGTMHTTFYGDTTGVKVMGLIPQVRHTYAYLNTAYPCLNEKQLAIGEATFGGPDTLVNPKGWFNIEELERIVLQRCDNARDAIRLMGELVKKYGYGDGGECLTIADKNEVWEFEIVGEGKQKIGACWAAQRIPDDEVGVNANIPRIGKLQRNNPDYFMCSDNCERVAKKYGLWDGKSEFKFWKAFNTSYANGKNFREREWFILSTLAPSLNLSMDADELPFSVKPDAKVSVRQVMELFRSTYEGTDLDMTQNLRTVVNRKDSKGKTYQDTVISPIANPWMNSNALNTYNYLSPNAVTFRRTVSVAWCSYSFITQLRDWLPDAIGGVCWMAPDNPAQTPRVPIFCGNTRLPKAYDVCGQRGYNEKALIWKYRKANKLATVAWGRTKDIFEKEYRTQQDNAFAGLDKLERQVRQQIDNDNPTQAANLLNDYTLKVYDETTLAWKNLEERLWHFFGMGF